MGYKDKKYQKDLRHQIYDRLTEMLRAGEGMSKKEAKASGTDRDKIFSYSTYETYRKHCYYFADYIRRHHPECTNLTKARKYANEWLQSRVDQVDKNGGHLSAWTIQTEAKALAKLYGIQPDAKDYFQAPKRQRHEIKRSRGEAVRDKHFSEKNNAELVNFCRGTGCRRNVLEKLTGRDLLTREEIKNEIAKLKNKGSLTAREKGHLKSLRDAMEYFSEYAYFIHHRGDKGGRERFSPIIGPHTEEIVARMRRTGLAEKVWQYVSSNADIHSYRGDYATEIYRLYARPIDQIPYDRKNKGTGRWFQSRVYTCRKDEKGKKLDKDAMEAASKALGHNRISIVADNYIRGL